MKILSQILTLFSILIIFSCENNVNNERLQAKTKYSLNLDSSLKIIKTTKQFITNQDGSVIEKQIPAVISFSNTLISFSFPSEPNNNFKLEIKSKEESIAGINYTINDKTITEVFVASGSEPQINLNANSGNTTFM